MTRLARRQKKNRWARVVITHVDHDAGSIMNPETVMQVQSHGWSKNHIRFFLVSFILDLLLDDTQKVNYWSFPDIFCQARDAHDA